MPGGGQKDDHASASSDLTNLVSYTLFPLPLA
jgi:hypothetical protein